MSLFFCLCQPFAKYPAYGIRFRIENLIFNSKLSAMKKNFLAFLSFLFVCGFTTAQVVTAKPVKKIITLTMPGENGSNGASVVWHPVLKKYYAAFAGNDSYPLAVFGATGKRLSDDELETMFDMRGMWYNTVSKKIEANGYFEGGWISYKLDANGIPLDIEQLKEGMLQPDEQSVGVFDGAKKRICFLSKGNIISYSLKGVEAYDVIVLKRKEPKITEGELEDKEEVAEGYNTTSLCYTGIANAEFAILNYNDMQIELYNRKGILTKAFKVPEDVRLYDSFNFSFANGIWWFFDKEARQWVGCK
jgi:hypothetical protein